MTPNPTSHASRRPFGYKVTQLSKYIRVVGVAWSVLLVVIFGVFVVQGLDLL